MNPWLLIFRLKALHLSDTVCIVKGVILTLNPMVKTLVYDHSIESYWTDLSFGTVYNIVQVYSIKQLCDFVLF